MKQHKLEVSWISINLHILHEIFENLFIDGNKIKCHFASDLEKIIIFIAQYVGDFITLHKFKQDLFITIHS